MKKLKLENLVVKSFVPQHDNEMKTINGGDAIGGPPIKDYVNPPWVDYNSRINIDCANNGTYGCNDEYRSRHYADCVYRLIHIDGRIEYGVDPYWD